MRRSEKEPSVQRRTDPAEAWDFCCVCTTRHTSTTEHSTLNNHNCNHQRLSAVPRHRRCYEHITADRGASRPAQNQGRSARQPRNTPSLRGRGPGQICQRCQGVSCSLRVQSSDHVLTVQCRASSCSRVQDVGNLSPAPRRAVQIPAAAPAEAVLSACKASER